MYYILNETNQIIAIGDKLLSLCGLSHIDQLTLKTALGDIKFRVISENILTLTINNRDKQFAIHKERLSSMMGDLILVNVMDKESEKDIDIPNILHQEETTAQNSTLPSNDEDEFSALLLDDTIEDDDIDDEDDIEETISMDSIVDEIKEETPDDSLELDLGLLDEVEIPKEETLIKEESPDFLELELDLERDDEVAVPKESPIKVEKSSPKVEEAPLKVEENIEEKIHEEIEIKIDIEKTSSAIGVSIEDYNTFLNEYIDNALDLEEDIKGDDKDKHLSAIGTIAHLSEVLHIPLIGDIIDKIEYTPSDTQKKQIELFYDTLSKITTYEGSANKSVEDIPTPQEEEIEPEEEIKVEEKIEEEIEDELFFEDTPEDKSIAKNTASDDMLDLFDTPTQLEEKKEEEITPLELDTVSDDDMIDLFDTPVEEKKEEEITPLELDTVSDDDILDLFDTPIEEKKEEEIVSQVPDDIMDLFGNSNEKKEEENVLDAPIVEEPKEEIVVEAPSPKGFGTLDLSDVKPIHFDFQLEEAANDLSLPVELIEEFVNDFIDQAREETEKMLKCYEEGDLDAIQKIGHLLKGTSSNLRIKPLADTLYKIQFCEDSNHLEHFIRDYWGHFLSFEIQINAISH